MSPGPLGRASAILIPVVLSFGLAAGALLPTPSLIDPIDGMPVTGVHLEKSATYVLLSPLCELLDGVTSLGLRQHQALLASTCLLALAVSFVLARRWKWGGIRTGAMIIAGLILGAAAHALLLGATGWLPRPMAALRAEDADRLVIDFHSHSEHSHDGRIGLSIASNRRWHAQTGFHAAYLTDHNSQRGLPAALASNPSVAGGGTTLLPGVELSIMHMHIVVLGDPVEPPSKAIRKQRVASLDFLRDLTRRKDVITIASTPEWSTKSWPLVPWLGGGLTHGMEITTGIPQAMDVPLERLRTVERLAREKDFFLVTGSDYHGLGKAAYTWSVMHLPGWRTLSPAGLHQAIVKTLKGGRAPVWTVIRSPAWPGDSWKTPLVAVALPVGIVRGLIPAERLSWLAWIWVGFLGIRLWRRRVRN